MNESVLTSLCLHKDIQSIKKPSAIANTISHKRENITNATRSSPHPKNGEKIAIRDSADKYKRSLTPYMSDHICITNSNKEGEFQIKCEI